MRGQQPGVVNRTSDNQRALTEASRARNLIRNWNGPSGPAAALARQAALKLDDSRPHAVWELLDPMATQHFRGSSGMRILREI